MVFWSDRNVNTLPEWSGQYCPQPELAAAREMLEVVNSPIGIAGAGRIGQALGRLLRDRGEQVVAVAGRDSGRTGEAAAFIGEDVRPVSYAELPHLCSRILITVPDDALDAVVRLLAETMHGGIALHTCGTRGPEALAPLEAAGVSCAAMHPLQTVTTPQQGLTALPGAAFGISGPESPALAWARQIAVLLQGEALRIHPEQRPLYHAAAVMASNYTVALLDAAVILLKEAGVEEQRALRALTPLIRASVGNALTVGPLQALTGPIERGDTGTVAAHLRALTDASVPESVKALYRTAGLHAIYMARRKRPGANRNEMELLFGTVATNE
jgi:predicted short-subunit dehydrogenase-like oxidoreductase (DUF2520 family)